MGDAIRIAKQIDYLRRSDRRSQAVKTSDKAEDML